MASWGRGRENTHRPSEEKVRCRQHQRCGSQETTRRELEAGDIEAIVSRIWGLPPQSYFLRLENQVHQVA